jgi:hypothetical protein
LNPLPAKHVDTDMLRAFAVLAKIQWIPIFSTYHTGNRRLVGQSYAESTEQAAFMSWPIISVCWYSPLPTVVSLPMTAADT